jgi:DNA polymerase (family 10)
MDANHRIRPSNFRCNFPMTNADIASAFDEIAEILEFQNANPFRVRAYRNGARVIRDHHEPLAAIVDQDETQLVEIQGIGKDLAEKIATFVRTGEIPMLNELRGQVPASVLVLMKIPGMGPKKAAQLNKELGINTLEELKAACEAGKVQSLKGFGKKTEEAILHGMSIAQEASARMYWADADQVVQALREHLKSCKSIEQLEFAGSYRRGRDTVGDLDMLVVSKKPAEVMDRLAEYAPLAQVIGRGDTKMSVRLGSGLQIDLRVVPAESFGAALQYFTGSKDHNVRLRGLAKDKGLKINEYGVYRVHGDKETYIAGRTERDVYATLGLPVFPPELREARREFDWAEKDELPDLIELDDIVGDLHMHTVATDGKATLHEMIAAAQAKGLKYIAITDHSKRVSMARGMNAQRTLAQWAEIDEIRQDLPASFTLLKGIECDILEKGGMDLPDDVLAEADWVIASIHYGQKQSRTQITERMLGAIENKWVSMVAHPTGRILNQRNPYELDFEAICKACKKHGKLLELNAHPARLDLNDINCAAAKAHGIPIVINTDAHSVDELDMMRYGILQARRAGLTKHDVANTRSWKQMQKLVKRG